VIVVRPAAPADAAGWLDMRLALWPDDSREAHGREVARYFDSTAGRDPTIGQVLVAAASPEPDAPLVGFAELALRPYAEGCETSPVGFLEGWYVAPGHRRRGVGRALVEAAETWVRSRGCREFASDTQLDNVASAAAHRALGFGEVERLVCFRKSL
jgi:aminoglycoside 6'-N-acetyltransferase I